MKNVIYVILLLMSVSMKAQNLKIEGQGLESDKQVTLKYFNPDELRYTPLETKDLSGTNSFSFIVDYKGANLYELSFDEQHFIHLSVEGISPIEVIRTPNADQIQGSPSSLKILEFEQKNGQLQAKHFGTLKKEVDKAMKANDRERLNELQEQSKTAIQEFLLEFREEIVNMGTGPAAYHVLQFTDFNKELDFIEGRLKAFKKESPDALTTQALERQVYQAKVTAIGNTPPDIDARNRNDKKVSLDRFKGKILLIDFWAAWCRACRIENPKFAELYEQYQEKGFEILSISQDETEEAWMEAIQKDGVDRWQHVWDRDESISKLYSVSSLPQNIVLDSEGVIIAKNVSAEQLSALLNEVLP
jgi:peroxiredoxin